MSEPTPNNLWQHLPQPIPDRNVLLKAKALVAALLQQLASFPQPYGTRPPSHASEDHDPSQALSDPLAKTQPPADSPSVELYTASPSTQSPPSSALDMDFKIDFGDTATVQTRGKKATKKAAKVAQQAKWAESDNEGNANTAGDGGDDGADGNGGGGSGSGAGGDGNGDGGNNGGGDDDEWAFGTGKKNKKKTAKQKQEEEDQKRKEEEEAANATNNLSWADEANDAAGGDDWSTGFGGKKDKKKKGKKVSDSHPCRLVTTVT